MLRRKLHELYAQLEGAEDNTKRQG
jgi:hypothetical protein